VRAHGPAVGLPTWDDMGNSEVGHNALGAGQLIDQGARLVDKALADGSLFTQNGWQYISSAFASNTVHFIGLLSSGGVHSRANQLYQRAWRRLRVCLPLFCAPCVARGGTALWPLRRVSRMRRRRQRCASLRFRGSASTLVSQRFLTALRRPLAARSPAPPQCCAAAPRQA
jgi:hypothetical protein